MNAPGFLAASVGNLLDKVNNVDQLLPGDLFELTQRKASVTDSVRMSAHLCALPSCHVISIYEQLYM